MCCTVLYSQGRFTVPFGHLTLLGIQMIQILFSSLSDEEDIAEVKCLKQLVVYCCMLGGVATVTSV